MKRFAASFAALLVTASVFAAEPASDTRVIHDKTGFFVHLDIARQLSSSDTYGQCGIVPAQLRYLDHQNREHVLDYKVQAIGCPGEN
ncbi:DUF2790 domain-containing protein [Pseudomonas sp. MH9.3]|uniref:DUF2790 domain-containing protein n=1 Tax=Pseudomonas sp. MH9.3 TaxID=3048630 RepID=UPI002AC954D7|nr:DUF2790 domain-containing protein [Pseudomonas sp. MH9.3]MEB0107478.1 DUF2790 domain-containing protein [Pseudomonas sp. MH9.3]WPX80864.1 DUF2790 domain-containing protein [Pseudomonas sp. MH9.3]WQG57329.1 DUF2790 domain-containing protein [Pseudomonas sp. RTB3]